MAPVKVEELDPPSPELFIICATMKRDALKFIVLLIEYALAYYSCTHYVNIDDRRANCKFQTPAT